MNCHICQHEADFNCDSCGEPVCFDCCVKMTIHNQIDYPLCELCEDTRQTLRSNHYQEQEEKKESVKKEKERKAKIRRNNYWKPENIEKRRLAKIERKRKKAEQMEKMFSDTVRIVNNWFR